MNSLNLNFQIYRSAILAQSKLLNLSTPSNNTTEQDIKLLALKQAIDDQESYYRQERSDLYSCFASTRSLEVYNVK
jgi:hypothetical protein